MQLGPALLELRVAQAELQATVLFVGEAGTGPAGQLVVEGGPGVGLCRVQLVVGGHGGAFPLQPDEAEIGAGKGVVAIEQGHAGCLGKPGREETRSRRCRRR